MNVLLNEWSIENSKEVYHKDEKEVLDLLDWQAWELVINSATIIEKEVIIIILKDSMWYGSYR